MSSHAVEVLTLVGSLATPLAIAFIGLLINKTIQRQNAIVQRRSAWLGKWAEDFLHEAASFDNAATSFIMVWWVNHLKSVNNLPEAEEEQKRIHLDVLPHWLALERAGWEMTKYAAFGPKTGKGLEGASQALLDEASGWLANKGGNVQSFKEEQKTFNANVRRVHAELLNIDDSRS
jgi:hypothetical protein